MDAKERIRRARQADHESENLEASAENRTPQQQTSAQAAIENSLGPVLGWMRGEIQSLQRNQSEGLSRLQSEAAFIRNAIERSQRELRRGRWIAAIVCTGIALVAGAIGGAISPMISSESQRLQRLGTAVEASWQAMSPAERKQLEKLLGWSRSTEQRAQ